MTHDIISHLLDDYVSGALDSETSAAVSDHLATCAVCGADVEALNQVLAAAVNLPRSIDPPVEAWSNIRAAILDDAGMRTPGRLSTRRFFRPRPVLSAVAAAVVIALLSSAGTALYMDSRVRSAGNAHAATSSPDSSVPGSFAAFTIEENSYLRTASRLQDILDQQETALAPETVAQLKASLRTIDEAIVEARTALARDPANQLLIEMLSANYRQKVDLLRRSTEMTRGS
jgi:putative zinc finger protein